MQLNQFGVAVRAFPLVLNSADHTCSHVALWTDIAYDNIFEAVMTESNKLP